jgi:putative MATE family efflux protein
VNSTAPQRSSLNAIAGPIVGEFVLGMLVAVAGLYLASHTSDAAAGSFGLTQVVLESLSVLFRVLAIGTGVVVGQALGSGRQHEVQRSAFAALGASTWAGLAVAFVLLVGHPVLLHMLNAPTEVLPIAGVYMMCLAPAMVLEAHNLSMAAVLRAHLYARDSLRIMILMHSTHLLLAWLLMRGVGGWDGLGLNGYALAYLASRALGLWLHIRFWRERLAMHPRTPHWWLMRWSAIGPILRVGIPGAAVELGYRLGFMVSIAATARLGVSALAAHAYTLQTLKFVLLISLSIGWAVEIMVGRLVGAGKLREADQMVKKGVRNGLLASGSLAVLAALSAPWLMQVFTKDPDIIRLCQTLLWLSVALELGRVFNLVVNGALRASGDVHYPMLASLGSLVFLLGAGSHWMGQWWGLPGIWLAYIADECTRGLLMWWRWRRGGWWGLARSTVRGLRQRQR